MLLTKNSSWCFADSMVAYKFFVIIANSEIEIIFKNLSPTIELFFFTDLSGTKQTKIGLIKHLDVDSWILSFVVNDWRTYKRYTCNHTAGYMRLTIVQTTWDLLSAGWPDAALIHDRVFLNVSNKNKNISTGRARHNFRKCLIVGGETWSMTDWNCSSATGIFVCFRRNDCIIFGQHHECIVHEEVDDNCWIIMHQTINTCSMNPENASNVRNTLNRGNTIVGHRIDHSNTRGASNVSTNNLFANSIRKSWNVHEQNDSH